MGSFVLKQPERAWRMMRKRDQGRAAVRLRGGRKTRATIMPQELEEANRPR
jgi:hypothetical protein